jgi:hypothetical protein
MVTAKIPTDATYDEALELIEDELYNGARVTPEWASLHEAAELRDEARDRALVTDSRSTRNDVLEDLRERNPGVPPWAFQRRTKDKKEWTGMRKEWGKNTEFDPDDWDDRGQLVSRPG